MSRIFLSYSRYNLALVEALVQDLEAIGNQVWLDQSLTGGQAWWEKILANIRDADIFIFGLSSESLESEACKSELNYAVDLHKRIVPILLSQDVNLSLLPHPLGEIQVTPYLSSGKESVFALLKAINSMPLAPPLPDPLPKPPSIPISYLSTVKQRIDDSGNLNLKDQIAIVFELKNHLQELRSAKEVRQLLLRMKRREDLLAKVAAEIDSVLLEIDLIDRTAQAADTVQATAASTHGPSSQAGSKPCPTCGKYNPTESVFCGGCGSNLSSPSPSASTAAPNPAAPPRSDHTKSRTFTCQPEQRRFLIQRLERWLEREDFECQELETDDKDLLMQVRKKGSWRKFVGMATALNIVLHQSGEEMKVTVGEGQWLDKAIVGSVSMFVLWPLAITAGIGAWQQNQMPDRVLNFIQDTLEKGGLGSA